MTRPAIAILTGLLLVPGASAPDRAVESFVIDDTTYGLQRPVWLYTSPGTTGSGKRPYNLFVFLQSEYVDELAVPAWTADYPRRVLGFGPSGRVRERRGELKPFKIFGPTCDTLDVLPRPLLLPKTIQQDDYIVFENMGAYSIALRTGFNGFYPNDWAIVDGE